MIGAISNALSGLMAASKRAEASAGNIANVTTAGSLDPNSPNKPYTPVTTVQKATQSGGVLAENRPRENGIVAAYDPNSPFANEQGLIGVPAVDLAEESVNLKLAELTYKANIRVLETAQDMAKQTERLFDKKV
jgi:flagellar basal-body rod protein FlgC